MSMMTDSANEYLGVYETIQLRKEILRERWKLHKRQQNKIKWLLYNLRRSRKV